MHGTHRKPRSKTRTIVRTALGTIALLGTTALAGAAAGTITHVTPAAAATIKTSPSALACDALKAYQDQPDVRTVTTLIIDADNLPIPSYMHADFDELAAKILAQAADVTSPSPQAAKYIPGDREAVQVAFQYAGEDCWGGA